ncbi:hypothetical protein [Klebsiella pneumoniae]|uniref:hypothetical protein n=1 Tax=Klebsiella pneumoniae TaxID=573 RepID=UPI002152F6C0|nr:hypothetical protein [Klebsiella pneumoniae]
MTALNTVDFPLPDPATTRKFSTAGSGIFVCTGITSISGRQAREAAAKNELAAISTETFLFTLVAMIALLIFVGRALLEMIVFQRRLQTDFVDQKSPPDNSARADS